MDLTLAGAQKDFPVFANGQLKGILTQNDLMKALTERDRHPTVASVIQKDFDTVQSGDMLETAFAKLSECHCHTLPVMHKNELVGLVTRDNLGEYVQIQAALNN